MVRSYSWLLGQGIQPNHVALIGDSAGGGLAITTILRARERGLPLPAATMPLSPWLDMEATGETFETNAAKDLLLDDSRKLADLARRSGVDVTLEIVPEMQHVFQFLAGTAPEADAAIRRLAD